jgi:hypothetical protein
MLLEGVASGQRTVVLAKDGCPPVSALDELLPLGHDTLELRQLPLLKVVLVFAPLAEIDYVELEHHAQLLVTCSDILEDFLGVGRVRQFAHGHGVVVVEYVLVHLPEKLMHSRAVGVVQPRRLLVKPVIDDGGVLVFNTFGVPRAGRSIPRILSPRDALRYAPETPSGM